MSVTVVALVSINEDQALALARYLEKTEPLLAEVGAKIVKRYRLENTVVGGSPVKTAIVVEYPTYEAVDRVFGSEQYKQAIPFRDKAFAEYSVHVTSNASE